MKTLILMRHAEAEPITFTLEAGADFDLRRNLSPKGKEQADEAGRLMFDKGYKIDQILVSTATRTQQTLDQVKKYYPSALVKISDKIYNYSEETLLKIINQESDDFENLMIIGHNPAIYDLAVALADPQSKKYDKLLHISMLPATAIIFTSSVQCWNEVDEKNCAAEDIIITH